MNFQTYKFEIKDLMTQFVNAFDEVVINRYTKDRAVVDKIAVRYVYAPKQRVLHDLINKAQHITLPVVAVHITSIRRAANRVFNKINGSQNPMSNGYQTGLQLQPVPVDIGVNMSILTRYQTDMDQIVTNWAPYTDPYIVISWKRNDVPEKEIRSKVVWDGSMSFTYPVDINNAQPARITCDTSFVIEGWLFKRDDTPAGIIFNIDADFTAVKQLDDLDTMQNLRTVENTDERGIVGRPQITFVEPYELLVNDGAKLASIYGKMFNYVSAIYLSGGDVFTAEPSAYDPFATSSLSATYPSFNGIPATFEIDSDNLITIDIPEMVNPGAIDVVIVNPAGYAILTADAYRASGYQYPFADGIEAVSEPSV